MPGSRIGGGCDLQQPASRSTDPRIERGSAPPPVSAPHKKKQPEQIGLSFSGGKIPHRDHLRSALRKLFRSLSGLGASIASGSRIALLGAAGGVRVALPASGSLNGSGSFGSSGLSGSLLVVVSTAAYHSDGSQNDDKRENLFHSVKRLIINNSYKHRKDRYSREKSKEKRGFSKTEGIYSKRSATEITSFLRNAFGNVADTLPFRMIASSVVRQFPTETENQGLS